MTISVADRSDRSIELALSAVTGALSDSITVLLIVVVLSVLTGYRSHMCFFSSALLA